MVIDLTVSSVHPPKSVCNLRLYEPEVEAQKLNGLPTPEAGEVVLGVTVQVNEEPPPTAVALIQITPQPGVEVYVNEVTGTEVMETVIGIRMVSEQPAAFLTTKPMV